MSTVTHFAPKSTSKTLRAAVAPLAERCKSQRLAAPVAPAAPRNVAQIFAAADAYSRRIEQLVADNDDLLWAI